MTARYSFVDLWCVAWVALACGLRAADWRAWALACIGGLGIAVAAVGAWRLHATLDAWGKRKAAELRERWGKR